MANPLTIGIAQLSDSVTIAAAKERGDFAKHNLDVKLVRYQSWAAMRDALGTGAIDAAHMLSPMVVASAAGIDPFPESFSTAFTINLNGNGITVSNGLYQSMLEAAPDSIRRLPLSAASLAAVIRMRQEQGLPALTFAHVYPHSMHAYELRYWLAGAGIDPTRDVHLVVVPPSLVVDALATGQIDGYCVGEPWNAAASAAGIGRTLITSGEIWSNSPEKVLAVRNNWAADNDDTHIALISALLESSEWVDQRENRISAAQIISRPEYVDAPFDEVVGSLTGLNRQTAGGMRIDMPDFNVFHRYAANFPWRSHAKWILAQMVRWGEVSGDVDFQAIAERSFRPDIFRRAALMGNFPCPHKDEKIEGTHTCSWVMTDATQPIAFGPDRFIDGRIFDPSNIDGYLTGFSNTFHPLKLDSSSSLQAHPSSTTKA